VHLFWDAFVFSYWLFQRNGDCNISAREGLSGKRAFGFDTEMSRSRLAGNAGGKIEEKLKSLGFAIVKPHASAIVKGRNAPLEEGAEETFKQLGAELA